MRTFRTIALFLALGAGSLAYPAVRPWAQPSAIEAARTALDRADYNRAVTLYTEVLQGERPDTAVLAVAYQERGIARHKGGAPLQAIADYTNAIWLGVLPQPQLARTFLNRGIAYVEVGELVRARNDFGSAIDKDPGLADAYFGRATVSRLLGKADQSVVDYDRALELRHGQAHLVYYGRGLAQEALGAREKAVADFAQAAALAPAFLPARTKLANLGAPLPSDDAQRAAELSDANLSGRQASGAGPSTIALADAGDILTLESGADEPTGALSRAPSPGVRASTPGAAAPPAPRSASFLRPSSDLAALSAQVPTQSASAPPTPAAEPANDPEPTGSIAVPDRTLSSSGGPSAPDAVTLPAAAPEARSEDDTMTPPAPPGGPTPLASAPQPAVSQPAVSQPVASEPPMRTAAIEPPPRPPAPAKPAVARPAPATGIYVQLGAFGERSGADQVAEGFASRFPSIAAQHAASVEAADRGAQGTIYRVRVGPLASVEGARALCDSLRKQQQVCVPIVPTGSAR